MLSLDPFGKPAPDLPVGVTDYATSVRVHGDQMVPERQPGPGAGRPLGRRRARRGTGVGRRAAASRARDRVLSTARWDSAESLMDNMLAVFAAGASLVQVANPDAGLLDRRRQTGEGHRRGDVSIGLTRSSARDITTR